ncbi:K(+)-transporting ATPase subunit F [Clostridium sp. 19966]|nr:K(+)-transporting ATPase subunit F [Clostridium sp. 19966]
MWALIAIIVFIFVYLSYALINPDKF